MHLRGLLDVRSGSLALWLQAENRNPERVARLPRLPVGQSADSCLATIDPLGNLRLGQTRTFLHVCDSLFPVHCATLTGFRYVRKRIFVVALLDNA